MVLNDSFSSLKIKTDKSVSISSSMTPWSAYVHSQCHNWFVLYPEALPHSHETPANKSTHQKLRPTKVHVKNSGQQKYTSKTPANKSTRQKLRPTKVHIKNSGQQKYTSKTLANKSTRQKLRPTQVHVKNSGHQKYTSKSHEKLEQRMNFVQSWISRHRSRWNFRVTKLGQN